MRNRLNFRKLYLAAFLVVAFALGMLLSGAVSNAQYMRSVNISCLAQCLAPGHGAAICPDDCNLTLFPQVRAAHVPVMPTIPAAMGNVP